MQTRKLYWKLIFFFTMILILKKLFLFIWKIKVEAMIFVYGIKLTLMKGVILI